MSSSGFQWDQLQRHGKNKCVRRYNGELCVYPCAYLYCPLSNHHHWIPGYICKHNSSQLAAVVCYCFPWISWDANSSCFKNDPGGIKWRSRLVELVLSDLGFQTPNNQWRLYFLSFTHYTAWNHWNRYGVSLVKFGSLASCHKTCDPIWLYVKNFEAIVCHT